LKELREKCTANGREQTPEEGGYERKIIEEIKTHLTTLNKAVQTIKLAPEIKTGSPQRAEWEALRAKEDVLRPTVESLQTNLKALEVSSTKAPPPAPGAGPAGP
jgi:hypothetical protein